jgi:hypothetical protein
VTAPKRPDRVHGVAAAEGPAMTPKDRTRSELAENLATHDFIGDHYDCYCRNCGQDVWECKTACSGDW